MELTDDRWSVIKPLYSNYRRAAHPERLSQENMAEILFILQTGLPWHDLFLQRETRDSGG